MPAGFDFCLDYGTASAQPARGLHRVTGITQFNLKNADDDNATVYSAQPITAGNNSYEKFMFARWSGTYNQISTVKLQHTGGNLGAGLSLLCGTGGSGFYTTPATAANANLTLNLTSTGAISTGIAIALTQSINGVFGPEATGYQASSTANPVYSVYFPFQLQTTASASPGDTVSYSLLLQFLEN